MRCMAGEVRVSGEEGTAANAAPLSPRILFLFSLTCALAVANVYSAQPLLASMAESLNVLPGSMGAVITATQTGYAVGLIFLVPLGDRVNRKTLVIVQLMLSVLALTAAALAANFTMLLGAMLLVGLMAVVAQLMVAWAATLAAPEQRGKVVGSVTSGIVLGILFARFVSGAIADLAGWRAVYLTAACLLLLISLTLARVMPATTTATARMSYLSLLLSVFRLFITEPQLRKRGILALLIFAAFSMLWTSMVMPLSAMSLSHTQTGMFGLAGVAGALAASRGGLWADRGIGQRATGLALALLTLSWLPVGLLEIALGWLVLGIIMLDFAVQTVHVINQSLIIAARPDAASRLVGAYMCFYSLGSALGAIAATQLYALWGWHAVCYAGALVSACAFLFWLGSRHS
ncbi:MAG: MFS transporter [Atlantibacter hermannii]|uniref:Putative major facilitator superfamily transporter YgaY n=2 Tax=Atlantibacter hermannii TaxID=565 RepID=H5V687_ATLHE|nr:MFS transporter [Atlantibacter hermannii]MCQ4966936.1 MFS transporter [Enterobacteriaceae bacterium DFI.7.85]MDU7811125.1 MFS transporter [Atlantibacter hermannii]QPS93510.1 MFS transporter [Atlantibacter hermannii]VDZ73660.1 major facilitator family transporter [Atlantibacter hermannii]GAB53495.1 putative major facilitator superfamily transporter YgaY [Atlantibacter hermannii NBRC 105704]